MSTPSPAVRALAALLLLASCATHADPTPAGPPAFLSFDVVRAILHDTKGNYWFGSSNQGACRYDGTSLRYFTAADGLGADQVRSIHEGKDGTIWFECAKGISGFDGTRIVTPTNTVYTEKDHWQLAPDDLWFKEGGIQGPKAEEGQPGAYRYDGKAFTFHAYPVPFDRSQWPGFATTCTAKGKGRIWLATYDAVFGFDGKTLTVLDEKTLGLDPREGRLHIRSVYEDKKGRLWIGNNGIGVLCVEGGVVTNVTQQFHLGHMGMHGDRSLPLPGDVIAGQPSMHRVFSIGEDRDGNVWFGTVESGVWRFDGTRMRNFTAADGITTADVFAIYTDRNGDLWVAGHGVFRFDGTRFQRRF